MKPVFNQTPSRPSDAFVESLGRNLRKRPQRAILRSVPKELVLGQGVRVTRLAAVLPSSLFAYAR